MSTLDRYQVKAYCDNFFVMDHRFTKFLHCPNYEEASYKAGIFNENPEVIPKDPSTVNNDWVSMPKDAL